MVKEHLMDTNNPITEEYQTTPIMVDINNPIMVDTNNPILVDTNNPIMEDTPINNKLL